MCVRNVAEQQWQCWYNGRSSGFSADITDYPVISRSNNRYRIVDEYDVEHENPENTERT